MVILADGSSGVSVPAQYDPLIREMSSATGIPYNVIAAQASAESGFNARAVSSAGAEGWLQFLPTTYDPLAGAAGVAKGSEFDPASESKVYSAYMKQLLGTEKGNLRDALAAYNAGPGNKSAGYGYADSILNKAGTGNITVGPASGTTAGINIPGLGGGGFSVSGIIQDGIDTVLKMLGLGSLKDMMERLGLIILGFVLVIVGIHLLSSGSGSNALQTSQTVADGTTTTNRKIKTPVSEHKTTKVMSTGASEAAEAAVVA